MAESSVDDELWDDFHRVVNMTSHELRDWLLTSTAHEETEEFLDESGPETGKQVLAILGKRRTDLTPDDARVMRTVVRKVVEARGTDEPEPEAGESDWRHRLMTMGHDPLKPQP